MGRRGRPPYPDILTPREWEVLALLRENLTNEAIAARLGVSHAAAKYHVSEILSKLGVATREEAAAWEPAPEAAREPQLRRWRAGVAGWLRPVTLGKAALLTGQSRPVLSFTGRHEFDAYPSVSSDGRYVAYTDSDSLRLLDLATSDDRLLLRGNGAGCGAPAVGGCFVYRTAQWSPDGKLLLVQKGLLRGVAAGYRRPVRGRAGRDPGGRRAHGSQ